MNADEIAYWDAEARDDPRYAKASWGMNGDEDAEEVIEEILEILEMGIDSTVHRKHEVLEIGAGPGRLLTRLAKRHPAITFCGCDISVEMFDLYIATRGDAHNLAYDAHCLPRGFGLPCVARFRAWSRNEPCQFQMVYAVELFQHLDDASVQTYIDQSCDVLMPGGWFIAQYVASGEPGPRSFPRSYEQMAPMFGDCWQNLSFNGGAIHPDWVWVAARKR